MIELKKEYNHLIARINKAEKFFKTCTDKELEKHLPLHLNLYNQSISILFKIEKLGYIPTIDEIERGFNLGKT